MLVKLILNVSDDAPKNNDELKRELHVRRVYGPMADLQIDHPTIVSCEREVGGPHPGRHEPDWVIREGSQEPSGHPPTKKRPDALKDQVS